MDVEDVGTPEEELNPNFSRNDGFRATMWTLLGCFHTTSRFIFFRVRGLL